MVFNYKRGLIIFIFGLCMHYVSRIEYNTYKKVNMQLLISYIFFVCVLQYTYILPGKVLYSRHTMIVCVRSM